MATKDTNKTPGAPDFESAEEWVRHNMRMSMRNHLGSVAGLFVKGGFWLAGLIVLTQCGDISDLISINIDWTNSN